MNKLDHLNYSIEHNPKLKTAKQLLIMILGDWMMAATMNFLITPMNLYCSGAMGVAQLIALGLTKLGMSSFFGMEWPGIVYWALSIPALLWGGKKLGKKFLIYTIISISAMSLFIAIMPVSAEPIIHNEILAMVAGGFFGGMGVGFAFTSGGGCGAGDVVGLVLASTKPGFSAGKMNMIINVCIYTISAFLFGIETAVASIFFSYVLSWAMDKYHLQNHYMQIMIYTKVQGLGKELTSRIVRGVTRIEGEGVYTETPTEVLSMIVTKHEVNDVVKMIRELDPSAFVSVTEIEKVHGFFDKHFSS